ncbi:MAG: hypothetical protein RLZZ528_2738 [Pseudomonadota bacterium]
MARAVRRLRPQVGAIAISANGDPGRFAALGCPVLADALGDRRGPLAGIEAGLTHAAGTGAAGIVTVAVDTPFFPDDLVQVLRATAGPGGAAIAADADGMHPTFALWPVSALAAVRAQIGAGAYRLRDLAAAVGAGTAMFGGRAFFNINTPEDLARAEAMAEGRG